MTLFELRGPADRPVLTGSCWAIHFGWKFVLRAEGVLAATLQRSVFILYCDVRIMNLTYEEETLDMIGRGKAIIAQPSKLRSWVHRKYKAGWLTEVRRVESTLSWPRSGQPPGRAHL